MEELGKWKILAAQGNPQGGLVVEGCLKRPVSRLKIYEVYCSLANTVGISTRVGPPLDGPGGPAARRPYRSGGLIAKPSSLAMAVYLTRMVTSETPATWPIFSWGILWPSSRPAR